MDALFFSKTLFGGAKNLTRTKQDRVSMGQKSIATYKIRDEKSSNFIEFF